MRFFLREFKGVGFLAALLLSVCSVGEVAAQKNNINQNTDIVFLQAEVPKSANQNIDNSSSNFNGDVNTKYKPLPVTVISEELDKSFEGFLYFDDAQKRPRGIVYDKLVDKSLYVMGHLVVFLMGMCLGAMGVWVFFKLCKKK